MDAMDDAVVGRKLGFMNGESQLCQGGRREGGSIEQHLRKSRMTSISQYEGDLISGFREPQ